MGLREVWVEAINAWLHTVSDRTRGTYLATLRAFVHFQQPHVWEITTRDVEAWVASMEERGLAESTIQQNISVVSSFYKYAVQQELLGVNPVDGVFRVPVYADLPCLSIEQARDVLRVIPETVQGRRDYALLLAYLITGDLDARLWRCRLPPLMRRLLRCRRSSTIQQTTNPRAPGYEHSKRKFLFYRIY